MQIKTYDWLSQENLNKCVERLGKCISSEAIFEKHLEVSGEAELFNRNLIGNIDCIDRGNIYEFKCVSELDSEHFIQLAVYYYMNEMKAGDKNKYIEKYVYSLRTRELLALKNDRVIFKMEEQDESISGIVTTVYVNGRVNVRVNGKVIKSHQSKIISNLTIEKEMIDIDKKFTVRYYLHNILTNEMYEIKSTISRLKQMMELLIYNKYMVDNRVDDATFLKDMLASVKK